MLSAILGCLSFRDFENRGFVVGASGFPKKESEAKDSSGAPQP